jgi:serine/threonine-protein phosphatase 2A regulatory subunit B
MIVSLTSLNAPLAETEGTSRHLSSSHVLTASYNNFFHIWDVGTRNDVILQADKSAFKAKRAGSTKNKVPGPGGAAATRQSKKEEYANLDTLDFHKKILHASWHPRENTIALAATNNLFLFNQS